MFFKRETRSTMETARMIVKNSSEQVPLGALLLAEEIILPQDLDFALDHQKYTREPIGEILVRIGALAITDLKMILELQQNRSN
jgi:hypothetical protein